MKDDGFTKVALKALLCEDRREKEVFIQQALEIEGCRLQELHEIESKKEGSPDARCTKPLT